MTEANQDAGPSPEVLFRGNRMLTVQFASTTVMLIMALGVNIYDWPAPWEAVALLVGLAAGAVNAWAGIWRLRNLQDPTNILSAIGLLFLLGYAWFVEHPVPGHGIAGVLLGPACMVVFAVFMLASFVISRRQMKVAERRVQESIAAFDRDLEASGWKERMARPDDEFDGRRHPSADGAPGGAGGVRDASGGGEGGPGGGPA